MGILARLCFEVSRGMMRPPESRTAECGAYGDWRRESLTRSWSAFSDSDVRGKDVLDFGCGDGQLSFFLVAKRPRRILGVDLNAAAIDRCRTTLRTASLPEGVQLDFVVGSPDSVPAPDAAFDTLVAFDCLEHVMSPRQILSEWHRILRPGGRCLIEWFPFKGPWGPHMEALIPIPWAHVIFGERALFRAADKIYDLPDFTPRHWDLDDNGLKKPNKWRAWSSFKEQGYINQLDICTFREMAVECGFEIPRLERMSFGGSVARRWLGRALMRLPLVGEYFVSFVHVELQRPSVVGDGRGE